MVGHDDRVWWHEKPIYAESTCTYIKHCWALVYPSIMTSWQKLLDYATTAEVSPFPVLNVLFQCPLYIYISTRLQLIISTYVYIYTDTAICKYTKQNQVPSPKALRVEGRRIEKNSLRFSLKRFPKWLEIPYFGKILSISRGILSTRIEVVGFLWVSKLKPICFWKADRSARNPDCIIVSDLDNMEAHHVMCFLYSWVKLAGSFGSVYHPSWAVNHTGELGMS